MALGANTRSVISFVFCAEKLLYQLKNDFYITEDMGEMENFTNILMERHLTLDPFWPIVVWSFVIAPPLSIRNLFLKI